MKNYTREQIDENRQKWLAVLRDPKSKKALGVLESSKDPNARCCLGHACHALGLKRTEPSESRHVHYDSKSQWLPISARRALKINPVGRFGKNVIINGKELSNLCQVNDWTSLTPQEIADVIEDQFDNNNFVWL